MKKLFLFASILTGIATNAQMGIGTIAPHTSAQLEVSSEGKGALLPRMNETQRLAIQSPAEGLVVYQTSTPEGFYYYDGTDWTNIATEEDNSISAGTIVAYAGATAPDGWMLCSGIAISRSTHATLFAAIGTTYGVGNGSTTFNLPDLRGRTIFGRDNMDGTAADRLTSTFGIDGTTLGAKGGLPYTSLATTNMASHNHTFTGSQVSTNTLSHTHSYEDAYYAERGSGGYGNNARVGNVGNTDNDNSFYWRTNSNTHSQGASSINSGTTSHSHTLNATGTISNTGSGNSFEVINPGIIVNYIIKL